MEKPGFLKKIGEFLDTRIRTVRWNPRMVTLPTALKYGADDRDKIGCSAMHWAALNDRCDIITVLARHKADVNVKGNDGHSPLHWAALKGHVKAAQLLVQIGANVDAVDNWEFTPLIRASQNGHLLVVLLLLQEGADASMIDNEAHNALHWAVYHRHHLVVSWLLKEPKSLANIDAVDSKGATAVHLAVRKNTTGHTPPLHSHIPDITCQTQAPKPRSQNIQPRALHTRAQATRKNALHCVVRFHVSDV